MNIDLGALKKLDLRKLPDFRKLAAEFDVRERAGLIGLIILVWLALNLAFAFLVNMPRAARLSTLDDQVHTLTAMNNRETQAINQLKPLHRRVLDGDKNAEMFFQDVLSTKADRIIPFMREIRQIAKRFNISLDAISYPREEIVEHKITRLSAVMPLTGSYENLRSFVETIEKSENFIIIESIQLANAKEGGVILSLNIVLSTYFVDPDITDEDPGLQAASRGGR